MEGDHLSLLNVYNAFVKEKSAKWCRDRFLNFKALSRAISIRNQLARYLKRFDVPIASEAIRKCLASGFFAQAARAEQDGSGYFRSVRDNVRLAIHPDSVLFNRNPQWVVFHEVVETNQAYMRDLTVIEPDWLAELAPHFYEFQTEHKR
ncbi:hypothetical protein BCR43DRAFT_531967 [Syncephalastrum racemosum]|uniref:DEAD-box helicase OB fold domain-containing protein n=1 Tax=Syncephalastrum racemosum TaxID=13706 RepID=A0A1X2HAG0_SYNRA|nr:hypothetical protein BCR43DRAFT_531967 [Syncephalastrum racemosum]